MALVINHSERRIFLECDVSGEHGLRECVVLELVVAAHGDETAEADAYRVENLGCSSVPHLERMR